MKLGFILTNQTPISRTIYPTNIPSYDTTSSFFACANNNANNTCVLGIVPDNESQIPNLFEIVNITTLRMSGSIFTSKATQVKYFATENDLENFYLQSDAVLWAAIVFTVNGSALQYSIRINPSYLPNPTKTPCNPNYRAASYWSSSGFVTIQSAVEQALIQTHLPSDVAMPNINVEIGSYPDNSFNQILSCFIPLAAAQILVYGFFALIILPTNQLIREKQSKMKEFMKMAGLKEVIYWLSWLLTYAIPIVFIALITTLAIYFVLKNDIDNSVALLSVHVFLFGISVTTFAFFLVSFVKSTKIATLIAVLWIIIPSQFAFLFRELSLQIQLLAALIAPLAFQMGFYKWGNFEMNHLPQEFFNASDFTLGWGIVLLFVDSLLYLVLAWYISNILPGDFGVRKPFWFICTRRFWCSQLSEDEHIKKSEDYVYLLNQQEEIDPSCVEEVPSELKENVGIGIVNVTKVFQESHDKSLIAAVKNFSLEIYNGQILALLGHNGAGKTTLVSILTGMITPTSGTAYIYGKNIRTHMDEIRKIIGYCPQHDLLFDDLTGREHLQIFGELKETPPHLLQQSIDQVAAEVELADKLQTLVKHYSGGMKRKLCLGISLIGDSRVIFLDEPTSGLDPISRRNVWNLLKTKKENRIIILTTHYMEEADVLGDRIAIMANGRLKCCGSSLFLKSRYGIGYYMNLSFLPTADKKQILTVIKSYIPGMKVTNETDTELSVMLPLSDVKHFARMFADLEAEIKRKESGLQSYGISMTTLEDVFLAITHDSRHINRHKSTAHPNNNNNNNSGSNKESYSDLDEGGSVETNFDGIIQNQDIEADPLQFKPASRLRQFRTLVKKRLIEARRSLLFTIIILLLPSAFLSGMLGINYLTNNLNVDTQPKNYPTTYLNFTEYLPLVIPFNVGPMIDDSYIGLWSQFNAYNNSLQFLEFSNVTNLIDFVLGNQTFYPPNITQHALYGSIQFNKLQYNVDYDYAVLYNNSYLHSLPIFINLMNRAIYGNLTSQDPSLVLRVASHPLPYLGATSTKDPVAGNQVIILWATIAIVFGFAILGGLIGRQIVMDKEYQLRLQFNLFGVNSLVYWGSNFVVDVVLMIVSFLLVVGFGALWKLPAFVSSATAPALIVLGLEFVVALVVMDYVLSFIFNKSESCLKWIVLLNLATIVLILIVTVIVATYNFSSKNVTNAVMNYAPLAFPPSTFAYGLFTIQYAFQPLLGPQRNVTFEEVWSWRNNGIYFPQKLTALAIHTLLFAVLLFTIDSQLLKLPRWVQRGSTPSSMLIELEDSDVKNERDRLQNHTQCTDIIKAIDLSKNFGNIQAVNGITLGIPKNQCFGLLGPNGAGKSTTIALLTGQLAPSSGDVFLDSVSLHGIDLQVLYRHVRLGYCLQSNQALSAYLTVREHLEMYTNLRNELSDTTVRRIVEQTLHQLDLRPYAKRLAKNLSGGNKRKLSVAIALLVGNQILFLDEPSTGMDPGARRAMWKVIKNSNTMRDRCILLTTHSMEEAETVCGRIGIVVKGKLRCLGSNQHLKDKFGSGYRLSLSFKEEQTYQVQEFVHQLFPNANLLETMEGHRTYDVGSIKELSVAFDQIEKYKDAVGITNYSLSQTSLEQIFLHLAKQQEY
jgi:ABC-type multidrug transport system ATPase subunit